MSNGKRDGFTQESTAKVTTFAASSQSGILRYGSGHDVVGNQQKRADDRDFLRTMPA
jgi:hypothetical protein